MTGEIDLQTLNATLQQHEDIWSSLTAPVSKLDADQYMAEDLDGVTEGLSGSGNLNFLMMQAGQTEGALAASDPFTLAGDTPFSSMAFGSVHGLAPGAVYQGGEHDFTASGPGAVNSDPARMSSGDGGYQGNVGDTGFTSNTLGTLGASGFVADSAVNGRSAGSFSGSGGSGTDGQSFVATNGLNGTNGTNSGSGKDGASGTNGADGHNGSDGSDGGGGCGDGCTLIDIDLGDTIINLGDFTLIDAGDVTNLVTTTITEISSTINTVFTNITNNITNNLTEVLVNVLDGDGLTLHLDAVLSQLTHLNLDVISGDNVLQVIDHVIDLDPLTSLVEGLGLPLDPGGLVLADLHGIVSLLGGGDNEHSAGDTDLGLGLDLGVGPLEIADAIVDVVFNPVEDLAGDIDILADAGLALFDTSGIDNAGGDGDVSLGLDLALADHQILPPIDLDIPLDPLEAIVGDVDLDLGLGANILGDVAGGVVDDLAGGSGEDNILTGIREGLGDILSDLPDLPDLPELPDIGDIAGGGGDILPGIGLDLLDAEGTNNCEGDVDLDTGVSLDVAGHEIADIQGIDLVLDPLEGILGDIDIEIDVALDILNPAGDGDLLDIGLSNDPIGIGGLADWTESLLPGVGDAGNIGGDGLLDDALGGVLPDPVGHIAEGLGGLLDGIEHAPSGGGLFGGGLFR
ncbi:MAG: hypothetical protein IT559_04330 [Alphaproteobacteria bacterium]|nr:hypothetical protein [Alphaproteobacteria bacterium]